RAGYNPTDPARPGHRPPASRAERPPLVPDFREDCPMAAIAADRDLLFGLLALQVGLIDQGQLVAAFQASTRDMARPRAEHLPARGAPAPDQRAGVERGVGLHLKKPGGSAEKSPAATPAGRSTRESLAALGDPAIEHTLTQLAPGSEGDADRTA